MITDHRSWQRQQYRILGDNGAAHVDAVAQFLYKGYQVSFSTWGYSKGACLNHVAIFTGEDFQDHVPGDFTCVEDALNHIDALGAARMISDNTPTADTPTAGATISSQIREALPKLMSGELYALEYGDPSCPGGFLSYLRIRFLPTAGGDQFTIKLLRNGIEGSGDYYPEPRVESMIERVIVLIDRYHKPNPAVARALGASKLAQRTKLSFFEVSKEPIRERTDS